MVDALLAASERPVTTRRWFDINVDGPSGRPRGARRHRDSAAASCLRLGILIAWTMRLGRHPPASVPRILVNRIVEQAKEPARIYATRRRTEHKHTNFPPFGTILAPRISRQSTRLSIRDDFGRRVVVASRSRPYWMLASSQLDHQPLHRQ